MNPSTCAILEFLLTQKDAWNKDGELRYASVISDLKDALEAQYYDEWYWPKAHRAFHLMRILDVFPGAEWDEISVGYSTEIKLELIVNADEIAFFNGGSLTEIFEAMFYDQIQNTWHEWIDIPSFDEIIALGIRPPLVWQKEYADGAVQPSLFMEQS